MVDIENNKEWICAKTWLREIFPIERIKHDSSQIQLGLEPHEFYSLTPGSNVLLLGVGSGVKLFRLLTWYKFNINIICIESDPILRFRITSLARNIGLNGLTLYDNIESIDLSVGSKIDLMILEPELATLHGIETVFSKYCINTLIGNFDAHLNCITSIYRACRTNVRSFNLQYGSPPKRIVGKYDNSPEVSVIIDATSKYKNLDLTLNSLILQENIFIEILIALKETDLLAVNDIVEVFYKNNFNDVNSKKIQLCIEDNNNTSVEVALSKAVGEYISFFACGDLCDSAMFSHLYHHAAPCSTEMIISGYRLISYLDGKEYFIKNPDFTGLDNPKFNNNIPTIRAERINFPLILGRCLFRRSFLSRIQVNWPVDLLDKAGLIVLINSFFLNRSLIIIPECFYLHFETAEESHDISTNYLNIDLINKLSKHLTKSFYSISGNYDYENLIHKFLVRCYLNLFRNQKGFKNNILTLIELMDELFSRKSFVSRFYLFISVFR